jgi:hypothetical protein
MRARFRSIFRAEVARTVEEDAVEEEIRWLSGAL